MLLLFAKLSDLLLKIAHELVLLTDHAGYSLLGSEKHGGLLIRFVFEFCILLRSRLKLVLQMPDLVLEFLLLALVLFDMLLVQLLHRLFQKVLLLAQHLMSLCQLSLGELELHIEGRDQLLARLFVDLDMGLVLIQLGIQRLLFFLELLSQALVLY